MTITTTLVLNVNAVAWRRDDTPLSPFAQLVADDAGGLMRGPGGLSQMRDSARRLLRLHGAVAPDEVIIAARRTTAERLAMGRMMTCLPRTSVHAALTLPENEWTGEDLVNGVAHAMQVTGRVPDRLVVVMNEDEAFEEAFADRARWLLDVPDIVTRRVDRELGLLERDVLAVAPHAEDPCTLLSILEAHDGEGAL